MIQYPQPSPIFFTGQQGRDFPRLLNIAYRIGTLLLTPVAISLFFFFRLPDVWPSSGFFYSVLVFLSCFLLMGWIFFFQGIWLMFVGYLLLIKPSTVRSLAQKTASDLPWMATSIQQLALNLFWLSFCGFALDSLISFGLAVLPPISFYFGGLGTLFLLGPCGFLLIHHHYSR